MNKILLFTGFYFPGFKGGGPIKTIQNMVHSLGGDLSFNIFTLDRDLGDSVSYTGILPNTWQAIHNAKIFYTAPGIKCILNAWKVIRFSQPAVINLNSFFSLYFSIIPLLFSKINCPQVPVLIGPRGEFSQGALKLKYTKKRIFIWFAINTGLYSHVIWHASTEHEADDIRRVIGQNARIRIATDIACPVESIQLSMRLPNSPLRIIFISRISPMKNLLGAIGCLQNVKVPVVFDVYGPTEDSAYWSECQVAIKNLPATVNFKYMGALFPAQVPDVLSKYDLFLLPTLGENFGHAIAEALGVGLPVLISDKTPWRDLNQKLLGWDLPLNKPSRFVECIEDCYHKPVDEYNAWRLSIRKWALMNIGNAEDVDQSKRLFMNLHEVN